MSIPVLSSLRRLLLAGLLLAVWAGVSTAALAAFPDKPIKLIVPFPPGGAADVMARGMAQYLGQGCTLLFGTLSMHAIVPAMSHDQPETGVHGPSGFTGP